MKIVIDIPDNTYEYIRGLNDKFTDYQTTTILYYAVRTGSPLPKGHGRLIDENEITKCEQIGSIDINEEQAIDKLHETGWMQKHDKAMTERPRGEWIKGPEISRTMIGDNVLSIDYKDYTCSNCGLVLDRLLYHVDGSPFYKFCPECGADMRGGEE